MKAIYKVKGWWTLVWPMVLPLAVGYAWISISFLINFRPASSGAILIGTAIIAEIMLSEARWRKLADGFTEDYVQDSEFFGDKVFQEVIWHQDNQNLRQRMVYQDAANGKLKTLKSITPFKLGGSDSNQKIGEANNWNIREATKMVVRPIQFLIAISTILGSLLWAYGPTTTGACIN